MADDVYVPILEELAPKGLVPISTCGEVLAAFEDLFPHVHDSSERMGNLHRLHRLLAGVDAGRPREPVSDTAVDRIKRILDQAPEQHHDLQSLCRSHGCSYSHFRRVFRQRFHQAPYHYLMMKRMERAAQLLTRTTLSVQEIGAEVGIDDPAHFSKQFRAHHSLSPRAYRQSSLGL